MNFSLYTGKKSALCTLEVLSDIPLPIRVEVLNPNKAYTKYTDRTHTLTNKKSVFYIRMPQTPEYVVVKVNPSQSITKLEMLGSNLRIVPPKLSPLYAALSVKKWTGADSQKAKKFMEFAQPFCENAGILSSADSIYVSNDWKFRIDYKDVLMDQGKPSSTPARIESDTGRIEINKSRFQNYTVPERMAILLHEFSHFYLNNKMNNEMEADKNAFFIYLGMGYPRIDGLNAFNEIFKTSAEQIERNPRITPEQKAKWGELAKAR